MAQPASDKCLTCGKSAYPRERIVADGKVFHSNCFKCAHCQGKLTLGKYAALDGKYFCKPHFKQLFALRGNYNEGFGTSKHSKNWEPTVVSGAFKGVGSVIKPADGAQRDASPARGSAPAHSVHHASHGQHLAAGGQHPSTHASHSDSDFSIAVIIKEQGVEKQRLVLAC